MRQPEKCWLKDDKGFICYHYTGAGVTVVPIVVKRREPSLGKHYLSVIVSAMFSYSQFEWICWEQNVYMTKEAAEQAAAEFTASSTKRRSENVH